MKPLFSAYYTSKSLKITFLSIKISFSFRHIPWIKCLIKPDVSIIVPVYNVENYLRQCMDSIIIQTHTNIEIICINDGSTDQCGTVLDQYAYQDRRVTIITQPNRGLSAARNAGLKRANGKYILFVDSDDWLHPQTVAELYRQIVRFKADICVYGFHYSCENKSDLPLNYYGLSPDSSFTYEQISEKIFGRVSVWSKMYRRRFICRHNLTFPEGLIFEDVIFHVRSFVYASKICQLNRSLYYYRTDNQTSITNSSAANSKLLDIIKAIDMVYSFLENENKITTMKTQFCLFMKWHLSSHLQRAAEPIKNRLVTETLAWLSRHDDIRQTMIVDPILQNFYTRLQLKD